MIIAIPTGLAAAVNDDVVVIVGITFSACCCCHRGFLFSVFIYQLASGCVLSKLVYS